MGLLLLFVATSVTAQIRTVLVSPVPDDPVGSGTALHNALSGISSPSSTNRWLLKIEPGVYDIGATALAMRSWVDIEGSGIGVTTIRGAVDATSLITGTIIGASNAELRLVTVEAIGSAAAPSVIAMYNGAAFPRLYRVKLVAQSIPGGAAWGIRNLASAPRIEECEIRASAAGASSVAYGIVFRQYSGGETASILRSTIAVFGATNNYGIYMEDGQTRTELRDSRIDATGGTATYGVYAKRVESWEGVSSLSIRDVEVSSAGGSSTSNGVYLSTNTAVSLDVVSSKVWGHVAPTTYGIFQAGAPPVGVQHSSVTGFTQTVQSAGNVSIQSTLLQGGPATAGGWLGCMGVWDENGVFYANSCP